MLQPSPGGGNTPQTRMDAGFGKILKIFLKILRKTLKFPATLPLPVSDGQERVLCSALWPQRKKLKIFC
jgi:hypothetical protein